LEDELLDRAQVLALLLCQLAPVGKILQHHSDTQIKRKQAAMQIEPRPT
jgi:hypothetical protein